MSIKGPSWAAVCMLNELGGPNPVKECTLKVFPHLRYGIQIFFKYLKFTCTRHFEQFNNKNICITWQGILATKIVNIVWLNSELIKNSFGGGFKRWPICISLWTWCIMESLDRFYGPEHILELSWNRGLDRFYESEHSLEFSDASTKICKGM